MHARHAAALLAALILPLTACSGSEKADPPAASTPAPATSSAAPSRADLIALCADAIAAGKDEGDGAPECTDLSLDDYNDALHQANQAGRDALQKQLDEATQTP
jgi:hypothetical protein